MAGEWITFNPGEIFLIDETLGYNHPLSLFENTPDIISPEWDAVIQHWAHHFEEEGGDPMPGEHALYSSVVGNWIGSLTTLEPGIKYTVLDNPDFPGPLSIRFRKNITGAKPPLKPIPLPRNMGSNFIPTRNPSHVPPALKLKKKKRR